MESRLTTGAALRVFIVVSLVIIAVFSLLPLILAIFSLENTGYRPHFLEAQMLDSITIRNCLPLITCPAF